MVEAQAQSEAIFINKSNAALTKVLMQVRALKEALARAKQAGKSKENVELTKKKFLVSYGESKLTHMLQGALSESGKTLLLATVRSHPAFANESSNTLNFASGNYAPGVSA
jgi:hypothetical protein